METSRSKEQGIEQGIEKGIEPGIQQGISRGLIEDRAEGMAHSKREIAKLMKNKGLDVGLIVECTGLSEIEIENL